MLIKLSSNPIKICVIAIVISVQFSWYLPHFQHDTLLHRDDQAILAPLIGIAHLQDYISRVIDHRILDIQPIRDLSYLADQWLITHTPFWSYHLSNYLIFLCFIIGLYILIIKYSPPQKTLSFLLWVAIALNPMYVNCVAWVSSRKQLLSLLFILIATIIWEHREKLKWRSLYFYLGIGITYLLSVLSHPIAILWPLYPVMDSLLNKKHSQQKALWVFLTCLPTVLLIGGLNFYYYTVIFPKHHDVIGKFAVNPLYNLEIPLLAFSRGVFNFLFPFTLSVEYFIGSQWGLASLATIVLFSYLFIKIIDLKTYLSLFLFAVILALPALVQMSQVFWMDTYFLTASIPIIMMLHKMTLRISSYQTHKVYTLISTLLIFVFCWVGFGISKSWQNDHSLWKHAYQVEPTPKNIAASATWDLNKQNYDQAIALAEELKQWSKDHPLHPFIVAKASYHSTSMSIQEKQLKIKYLNHNNPWVIYYEAFIMLELKQLQQAANKLDSIYLHQAFIAKREEVTADTIFLCELTHGKNCNELANRSRKDLKVRIFSQQRYNDRLELIRATKRAL